MGGGKEDMINEINALAMLKSRLNRLPGDTTLDDYLTTRIHAAIGEIEATGITLNDNIQDMMLVVDYTAWSYANRDKNTGMPEWLRLRRRERWLQEGADGFDPR